MLHITLRNLETRTKLYLFYIYQEYMNHFLTTIAYFIISYYLLLIITFNSKPNNV